MRTYLIFCVERNDSCLMRTNYSFASSDDTIIRFGGQFVCK